MTKKKPTDTGMNRTGMATSPIDSARLVEAAKQAEPAMRMDGMAIETERIAFAREADPLGTVPPPASLKGVAKTILEKLQRHKPTVFIDKLGERLAFERTGTRLYDALLAKLAAASVHQGGPTREELERIRDEENRHVILVREAIEQLGADPTAMTPCADLVGVAGLGWVQALTDPRTTLTQGLDIILMAELADNDSWSLLIELAEGLGFSDLASQFREALVREEEHLVNVRAWLSTAVLGQSGVAPTPERTQPTAP
jgi:rubrerythrin